MTQLLMAIYLMPMGWDCVYYQFSIIEEFNSLQIHFIKFEIILVDIHHILVLLGFSTL